MTSLLPFTHDYIFHTIQGEGKYTGTPSVFARLSGCNLRCAWKNSDGTVTRCDTPYSSFEPEKKMESISDTIELIHSFHCKHVVITGGEPFLFQSLSELINPLVDYGHFCTIETNGTRYLETKAQFISLSPKLLSSTAYQDFPERINIPVLTQFTQHHDYQFKFVINTEEDVNEVMQLLQKLPNVSSEKIYLMPQAITPEELEQKSLWVADLCKKHNWNYADRLHLRLWGSKRGV